MLNIIVQCNTGFGVSLHLSHSCSHYNKPKPKPHMCTQYTVHVHCVRSENNNTQSPIPYLHTLTHIHPHPHIHTYTHHTPHMQYLHNFDFDPARPNCSIAGGFVFCFLANFHVGKLFLT